MKKILLLILLLAASLLAAQDMMSFSSANNASAYSYSGTMNDVDQLKIYTYVWGQVRKPGLYIVPDNTDLLALLSLAGGPTENAKMNQISIVRPTDAENKVLIIDLRKYMETGAESIIPVMQPGDMVMVSGTFYYAVTKAADFVSKIAIVLTVWLSVNNISN